jgi:hypothetical protein
MARLQQTQMHTSKPSIKNEANELEMGSRAQWPRFWSALRSALRDYKAEMLEVEIAEGHKKIKPLADDEIFDIVLEKVRATFPRTNTPHLNTKGTKEELTADRIEDCIDLLQTQESEIGLSAKRIRDEVKVNFTGFTAATSATKSKISTATRQDLAMAVMEAHCVEEAKVRERRQARKG